jgi:rhomboid family GlyGly-CTERM serine protease
MVRQRLGFFQFFPQRLFARGWWGVSAVLLLFVLSGSRVGEGWHGPWALLIDWQPERAWSQPWRWWTPVAVHYSWLHWLANLVGLILVACLGAAARVPGWCAVAWCLAWPLTHLGLLWRPELLHFGGLSGVLHAGVSIIALWLMVTGRGVPRILGWVIALVLLGKVLHEAPWGPVVQYHEGLRIFVVPWAHATGVLSGLVCGAMTCWVGRARLLFGSNSLPKSRTP